MATEGPNLFEHASRGTQLWILDHLQGISSRMLLVLRAIDNKARGQQSVTMTREEIARFWMSSIATVQRAIEDLEKANLLICRRASQRGKCQGASSYQIVWSNLRALAEGESIEPVADVSDNLAGDCKDSDFIDSGLAPHCEALPAHGESAEVHSEAPAGAPCAPPQRTMSRTPAHGATTHYIPRNNRKHRLPPIGDPVVLEMAAAAILKECGLDHPVTALEKALPRGLTLEELQAIADFFRSRPGCWDAGALHRKVSGWMPGDAVQTGWPKADPKWLAKQKRGADSARAAQQRKQRDQAKAADADEVASLEAMYGPALDAMSDSEIGQFIQDSPTGRLSYARTWRQHGRASPSLRRWLLREISQSQHQE